MKRVLLSSAMAFGLVAAVAAGAAFSGVATASGDKCNVPAGERQPMDALKQKLEAEGWTVKRIKTDDGCYEVYGVNAKGQRVEAYFNPKNFGLVKSEMDD